MPPVGAGPPALPPAVYTDEKRLRQILINLLSNAIKFTKAGFVRFAVTYRNQVADFIIEDSGIGILAEARGVSPAEVGTTTFRPFYTPVSFGALTGQHTGRHFQPIRRSPLP